MYNYLEQILPIELVDHIFQYDGTFKQNMDNVIEELHKYNDKIEEYWTEQEQEWYMSDWQISCRRRWDPQFANRASPYILKNIHQFLW
jgi:hypothetical protein